MKTHFFDIESLDSVFTMAIFKPEIPAIDLYMIAVSYTHLTLPTK